MAARSKGIARQGQTRFRQAKATHGSTTFCKAKALPGKARRGFAKQSKGPARSSKGKAYPPITGKEKKMERLTAYDSPIWDYCPNCGARMDKEAISDDA